MQSPIMLRAPVPVNALPPKLMLENLESKALMHTVEDALDTLQSLRTKEKLTDTLDPIKRTTPLTLAQKLTVATRLISLQME